MKRITIVMLMLLLIFTMSSQVFASSVGSSIVKAAQEVAEEAEAQSASLSGLIKPIPSETGNKIGNISGIIVRILQVIGVAAAIIMLVFLGIKYVSAAPAEKADIKKGAVIYIVGAVLLLGATVIIGLVEQFVTDIGGK